MLTLVGNGTGKFYKGGICEVRPRETEGCKSMGEGNHNINGNLEM